jgi:KDEL-tailed cysteine endopeptidase
VGLNQFADRTNAEFSSQQLGLRTDIRAPPGARSRAQQPFRYANATVLPPTIDWRAYGAVTHVKNQRLVRRSHASEHCTQQRPPWSPAMLERA